MAQGANIRAAVGVTMRIRSKGARRNRQRFLRFERRIGGQRSRKHAAQIIFEQDARDRAVGQ